MFLSNALKEKLRAEYLEGATDDSANAKFPYKPHPSDPRCLINFKETIQDTCPNPPNYNDFTSQQLSAFDKKLWESTFTIKNLQSRWKGKVNLNFENNFQKFQSDVLLPKRSIAKKYIKNLVDPDILEIKDKKFDLSTDTSRRCKSELKKDLFEMKEGLKNVTIIPIKEHKVEEGVETRNHRKIDGNIWNISNYVNEKKLANEYKEISETAQENSLKYWKENEDSREMELPLPIRKERKKVELPRFFKKYKSPYERTIEYYNTMSKIKEESSFEKDNIRKNILHNHPYLAKCPEKLNALVFKELKDVYQNKYDEIQNSANKDKNSLTISTITKNNTTDDFKKSSFNFKWNDTDLANKITAINKLKNSGLIMETPDKNNNTINSNKRNTKLCLSYDKNLKYILLPLVIKGKTISNEEEKIEEKIREDLLKQQKKEILLNEKKFKRVKTPQKFISKYPLNKNQYEITKKLEESQTIDFSNKEEDALAKKIMYIKLTNSADEKTTKDILNEISTNSGCGPHFLEAYNTIASKELEKLKENNKKMKESVNYEYTHPGAYREFTFIEKTRREKQRVKNEFDEMEMPPEYDIVKKQIKETYWSCCMNPDKDSKGCQKTAIRKFQYLYDDI